MTTGPVGNSTTTNPSAKPGTSEMVLRAARLIRNAFVNSWMDPHNDGEGGRQAINIATAMQARKGSSGGTGDSGDTLLGIKFVPSGPADGDF